MNSTRSAISLAGDEGVAEQVAYCRRDVWQKGGAILMMPTRGEVEPQRMDVTISRAKQVMLLDYRAIDKGVAERVAYCRRDVWQKGGAILMMPTRGEVEPQRMDVTISGAKQVVLLKQSTIFVNKGVAEWVTYCGRDVWQNKLSLESLQ